MPPSRTEAQSHARRNLISHLSEAGETARLFELLEHRGFLAAQADFFGDFGRTSEDVETFVLPATIAAPNWNRFLCYATVALNLRSLAEDLAEPEILQALVRSDRRKLALDLAGRLVEPLRRAAALSVIAQECRGDPALFRQMVESLGQSLEAPLPASPDPAEVGRRTELLARMARLLGPDLSQWSVWIGKACISPEQAAPVWRAVAESWLDRGEPKEPALWEALRQIRNPQTLLAFLPEALGKLTSDDPEEILAKLSSLFSNEDERRCAEFSFLGCLARSRPEGTHALWEDRVFNQEILWTVDMIETAGPLLALADPERLQALADGLGDPVARAALRVVVLKNLQDQPGPAQTEAALAAVEQIPDGPEKLHWSLRYLESRPSEPEAEARCQVAAVAWYLYEIRYAAPPEDLRRFLDLIACFFPTELPFQAESVFTSPASHPDVLHALVHSAQSTAVLDHVMEHAARYASLAALNESQAFRLRGETLTGAACRLCLLGKDPSAVIKDAAQRLLPQEEDEARFVLVPLAISFDGAAKKVAEGIQDGRRKLIAQLRAGSADSEDLKPSRLYAKVARIDELNTELSGLIALLGPPNDPELLERAPEDRVDICLRLGWHALSYEAREFEEDWDPRAVLSRIAPKLVLESDEQLVAWTPAIVALAAQPRDRQAVAEVTEAAERIAGLDGVPWSVRREALGSLLASIPTLFLPLDGTDSPRAVRRAKAALSTLGHLRDRLAPGKARDEIAAHWQEILPMVASATERLNQPRSREDGSKRQPEDLRNLIDPTGKSPSDPGVEPLVRRLWELSSDLIRKQLAEGVTTSLQAGGRPRAEAALRWWLHGHLSPRLGELHELGLAKAREAVSALSKALSLGIEGIENT